MHITDALIFLPHGPEVSRWLDQCAVYCQAHAYRVLAVVGHWDDIAGYLHAGFAGVVVVAEREHLPPDRLPRVEVVGEQRQQPPDAVGPPTPPGRRRPKPI